MKKLMFCFVLAVLLINGVLALNVEMEKVSENEIMVAGIDKPVVFDYLVKNLEGKTRLEFFNLLGFSMTPIGKVEFGALEEKNIEIRIRPIGEFNNLGAYTFSYFIRDDVGAQIQKTLTFKRIELKDALEVSAKSFDPDSTSIQILVKNKVNFNFEDVNAKFNSRFFNEERKFDLGAFEEKEITIELDQDEFNEMMAGFYTMDAVFDVEDAHAEMSANLEFLEKTNIKTEKKTSGFIVREGTVTKTNDGNVVAPVEIDFQKNIISRLFTTFSPEPDSVERDGFVVYYSWNKILNPGEAFEVTIRTNWLFPFILIILIVVVVIFAKLYTRTNLNLKKKVSFVKAKGGEFALKITLYAQANKYIENVNIIERLPPLVKIYEKFGANKPTRVDEKARRIDWNFEKLEAGEKRIISYIMYSKVGVMGKFSLPSARAIFERDGKIGETNSNRAFFVAEPRGKEVEEE